LQKSPIKEPHTCAQALKSKIEAVIAWIDHHDLSLDILEVHALQKELEAIAMPIMKTLKESSTNTGGGGGGGGGGGMGGGGGRFEEEDDFDSDDDMPDLEEAVGGVNMGDGAGGGGGGGVPKDVGGGGKASEAAQDSDDDSDIEEVD